MKKLIISALAALSFGALSAADTDQYLWWMIDDNVDIKNFDGTKYEGTLEGFTAKIVDNNGVDLYLYDNAYSGSSFGKEVAATDVQGFDIFAGIGDYGPANSFIVELWNEATGTKFTSTEMYYSALRSYIGSMKGMDTPSSVYSVKSFTAVPEPTSGLLLLLGVAGLALRRKNKKA